MTTAQRSTFVSVLAWIFIAFSGFGTLVAILQNVMVQVLFNSPEISQAMQSPPTDAPPFAVFMLGHFRLFFLGFLVSSAITLAASIGLLKRQNWARLVFIALMLLGIVWNLAGLGLQFALFAFLREQFVPAPGAPDMSIFFTAVMVFSGVFALAFCALNAWIAKRLMAPEIVAEFGRG